MQRIIIALAIVLSTIFASPALAQVIITQAKALAGNVTPGDAVGYPVTLSLPGAYVLGSNLTVPPGIYGLYATAGNVDIDMRGFTLSGNGGGTYGLISAFGESRIHGGVINRFRYSGMYLRSNAWTIDDMKIVRNGTLGVDATNASMITLRASLISGNGSTGIRMGNFGKVEDSTITLNRGNGLSMGESAAVENSTISNNESAGIVIGGEGRIDGNDVSRNGQYGVLVTNGALITSNTFRLNGWPAVRSSFTDSSLSNNYITNNAEADSSATQTLGSSDTYGNKCIGKPCF